MISTSNYKLTEILHDTWPNLYRPPHNYKPPSNYHEKAFCSTVGNNMLFTCNARSSRAKTN